MIYKPFIKTEQANITTNKPYYVDYLNTYVNGQKRPFLSFYLIKYTFREQV